MSSPSKSTSGKVQAASVSALDVSASPRPFVEYVQKVVNRENLSEAEARAAMEEVLEGRAGQASLGAFLVGLRMKGETAEELLGFASAMRARAVPVRVDHGSEPLLDTCGTGGDNACTFNISTVAAFVLAGTGLRVAKHGNRSISSHCGSADILESLGVNVSASPHRVAEGVSRIGIGFLFAPALHPAMRHAQAARSELRMRTAFNLLGPLTNPARATVQVVGAPSVRVAELLAQALAGLGLERGFVVHGADGLDEITTTGETLALEIRRGAIGHRTLHPSDFGLPVAKPESLVSRSVEENCQIARDVLEGQLGPRRDIVLANASAALVAAQKAKDFREGAEIAAEAIDSGKAMRNWKS